MKDLIDMLRSDRFEFNGDLDLKAADALESQAAEIESLRAALVECAEALRQSQNQLCKWQGTYGKWNPEWLPPAHDVAVSELSNEALTNARSVLGGE